MNRREKRVAVHMTKAEWVKVMRLARNSGYHSLARYMREASLAYRPQESTEDKDDSVLRIEDTADVVILVQDWMADTPNSEGSP